MRGGSVRARARCDAFTRLDSSVRCSAAAVLEFVIYTCTPVRRSPTTASTTHASRLRSPLRAATPSPSGRPVSWPPSSGSRRRRRRTSRRRRSWQSSNPSVATVSTSGPRHGDRAGIHDHHGQRPGGRRHAGCVGRSQDRELAARRRAGDRPDRADERADGVGVDDRGEAGRDERRHWQSSNPGVATRIGRGHPHRRSLRARSPSRASYQGVTGSLTVTVARRDGDGDHALRHDDGHARRTTQLTATAVLGDGSMRIVTNVAAWASLNTDIATVSSQRARDDVVHGGHGHDHRHVPGSDRVGGYHGQLMAGRAGSGRVRRYVAGLQACPDQSSSLPPRSALISPRRFFESSRFSVAARFGFVALRVLGRWAAC